MARKLVSCLAFASVCFYVSLSANDLLWPSNDARPRLLAQDALRAARESVHEVMWSFLEAYEDELRTVSERTAIDYRGTRFERLQTSLSNPHRDPSVRNIPLEELQPGPRPAKGKHVPATHEINICESVAGKRITMIGGEHIYRLHVLLLQHRERAEGKLFPCQYHEFCTHHHICLPYHHSRDDIPTLRYVKPPTTQKLIETGSAVVNYIVSDSLFSAQNESSWEYTSPYVDPMTGVRLRETYWLAAARKANVVALGRGPLSAPGQTYTGNWSFSEHVPDYVDKARVIVAEQYKHHDNMHMDQAVPRSLDILNAAVHLTVSRFLPDVFRLLQSIQREIRSKGRKRMLWPSSWYRLPGRGVGRTVLLSPHANSDVQGAIWRTFVHHRQPRSSMEHVLTLQLSALINADVMNTALLEDPWTLFFNAQVYLQNMVLRELLPRYGIVFLPLDEAWIEKAWARPHAYRYSRGAAIDVDVDFERTMAVGEAFLTGIDYVLRYLE